MLINEQKIWREIKFILFDDKVEVREFNETRNINFRLSKCKHCTCKQLITHGTLIVLFFSQHGFFLSIVNFQVFECVDKGWV
jgi:hypothetical protein